MHKGYKPKARSVGTEFEWNQLIGAGDEADLHWTRRWQGTLELDLFEKGSVARILGAMESNEPLHPEYLNRLRILAQSRG